MANLDWNFGLADQGKLTYNKVSGITFSIGEISNDVTKSQLIANVDDEMRVKLIKALKLVKDKDYINPYVGLVKDEDNVVSISYEREKRLYDEFMHCAQTKADWIKFLSDYSKVGRMRQELTIDYAKKLTDLSGISNLLMQSVICMGMKGAKISFDKKEGISYTLPSIKNLIDANPNKIIVGDPLWKTISACMSYVQRTTDTSILDYIQEQEPVYEIEQVLRDMKERDSIYLEIKNMFKDLVGSIRSEDSDSNDFDDTTSQADNTFNDGIARLENMLRAATKDISPEERAANIKACARRGNDESENTFYLHLCKPEYILWLDSLGLASVPFVGERLYDESDNENKVKEGDVLEFTDGECDDGTHVCFIEKPYSGKLKIFAKDGKLYAGKAIKDAVKVPDINNKATVKVMMSYYAGEDVKAKYETITNRAKNKTKIIKKDNKYFMVIRSADGEKLNIPVFVHKSLEDFIVGKYGNIVGTRCNLIHGNTKDVYVMYVDIDFD